MLAFTIMALVSLEAREHPRARARIKVAYHFGGTTGVGRSGDISEGGIFVQCDHPARVGTRVYLRLLLPGCEPPDALKIIGTVTRSLEPIHSASREGEQVPGMGVHFEVAYSRTRSSLHDFVHNLLAHAEADAPPEVELLEESMAMAPATYVARFPTPAGYRRAKTLSGAEVEQAFAFQADVAAPAKPSQTSALATVVKALLAITVVALLIWAAIRLLPH